MGLPWLAGLRVNASGCRVARESELADVEGIKESAVVDGHGGVGTGNDAHGGG